MRGVGVVIWWMGADGGGGNLAQMPGLRFREVQVRGLMPFAPKARLRKAANAPRMADHAAFHVMISQSVGYTCEGVKSGLLHGLGLCIQNLESLQKK